MDLPFNKMIVDSSHADAGTSESFEVSLPETISLPQHPSAKGVDLDVYPDFLELHSKHYHINHLKLPYKIDSDNGELL